MSDPVTDPTVTDPPASDPPATDPVVTDPVVTDPVVTDPVVTDPVVTDPVVTDPVVTDPVVTDPVVTDPVVTDPVVTDPVVIDPVVTDPITDPPPPNDIIIDDGPVGPFHPPTSPTTTKYGVTFQWDSDLQAIVLTGVKDLELLTLTLDGFKANPTDTYTVSGNKITIAPLTLDSYTALTGGLRVYSNPEQPSVFGNNFHTAFVSGTVQISSGTAYVSAPTLNMDIAKPGTYAVHWYVEVLIPDGAVEVLVLANGANKLSNTVYGQSSDTNDWRTISGFAVQNFPAGSSGVKLAYRYVDPSGQDAIPAAASTARNAKLMVYQVRRAT